MADATISGLVLDRYERGFVPRGEKERVEYFEAIVFDPERREFYVVRSSIKSDLASLEPSKTVAKFVGRFDKPCTIDATLVRGPRSDDTGGRF